MKWIKDRDMGRGLGFWHRRDRAVMIFRLGRHLPYTVQWYSLLGGARRSAEYMTLAEAKSHGNLIEC